MRPDEGGVHGQDSNGIAVMVEPGKRKQEQDEENGEELHFGRATEQRLMISQAIVGHGMTFI